MAISGSRVRRAGGGRTPTVPTALGRLIGAEVVRLLAEHPELSPNDVVFLCENHRDGIDAVHVIEDAGHPVHHIFSEN